MTYLPEHAHRYIAGVDRSPTEVAALFLADEPDGDPITFLVDALGLDADAAAEAVAMLEPQEPAQGAQEPADGDESDDDDAGEDEEPVEGAPSKAELIERAAELGVEVSPRWGSARIAEAIASAEAGA